MQIVDYITSNAVANERWQYPQSCATQTQINWEDSENIQLLLGPLIVASEGNFTMAKTEEQQMDFSILSAT